MTSITKGVQGGPGLLAGVCWAAKGLGGGHGQERGGLGLGGEVETRREVALQTSSMLWLHKGYFHFPLDSVYSIHKQSKVFYDFSVPSEMDWSGSQG